MDLILLPIGALMFIAGILLVIYNKKIATAYAGALGKATASKVFESRGANLYVGIRFYLAAALLLGFGGLIVWVSV